MTITVTREQPGGFVRFVWRFHLVELTIAMHSHREQTRQSKRHAWKTSRWWGRADEDRDVREKDVVVEAERPPVPEDVRAEAIQKVVAQITCQ